MAAAVSTPEIRLQGQLAPYLHSACLPDWTDIRLLGLQRGSGGFSYETWFADLEDAGREGSRLRLVIRREPATGPIEPYDISREAGLLAGLAGTGVPVPRLLAHCHDPEVFERPFVVMEHVEGEIPDYRNVMDHPDWQAPAARGRMADEFVRILAEVQRVDCSAPAFAGALAAPPSERERLVGEVDRLMAIVDGRAGRRWPPHPAFRDVGLWLKEEASDAEPQELVLVHGDYKLGNFIWRDGGIVAVLDWEGADVGDPLQDLGYACHPIMREQRPELAAMLAPLDELIARYEAATGRSVDRRRLHYYVVYALFFHTFTVLLGLITIVDAGGDVRLSSMYSKLNQVTRHLVAQVEAYEDGAGVL